MDLSSAEARQAWLEAHADYFTVVRAVGNPITRKRYEVLTLEAAVQLAKDLCLFAPETRWLIYAVKGTSDSWVRTVQL